MSSRFRTILQHALALVGVIVLLGAEGCWGEDNDTPIPTHYRKELIILPSGSIIATRYWLIHDTGAKQEISAQQLPQDAKVTYTATIVRGVQAVTEDVSLDILAPAEVAAAETTIVALFAGGRIPNGPNASTRAAFAVAGQPLQTGLNMVQARNEHSMVSMQDGRILITGGYGAGTPTPVLGSAEIFSATTRTFAPTGNLRRARADHASAALSDGRVLVTGGLALSGAGPATIDIASTETFSPTTGTFADGPNLTTTRFNHSAVTLNDGRVLVLGGNGRRSAEVYTPSTNSFTAVGDMSVVHGNGHVAVLLPSGKVAVFGGDAGNINPTAVVDVFDPATNSFAAVGSMRTARMSHFAVLRDDGKVFIGGGRGPGGSPLASAEIYDPADNSFTPTGDLPGETYDAAAAYVKQPVKE